MKGSKRFVLPVILLTSYFYSAGQEIVSTWTRPSWSNDSRRIAYSSHDGSDWELFTVDIATGKIIQITDDASNESCPDWSPDGNKLVFESDRDGNIDIYCIVIESRAVDRLTSHPMKDLTPVYSPDGQQIAFTSYRKGDPQIFLMNRSGQNKRQLTLQGRNEWPSWSFDGSKIVYHSNWFGHWEIMMINKDGSQLTSPTHHPDEPLYGKWNESEKGKYIGVPTFSPDDQSIAFHAAPERVSFGIYYVDLETMKINKITNSPDNESFPSWSPDGGKLAFRSNKGQSWGLYTINKDGSDLQLIAQLNNPE